MYDIRDLLIIFESTRYDAFLEADTPSLDEFGEVVKAYTHGTWTRPSIVSMLSGYLPTSELGQIYEPHGVMLGRHIFKRRERVPTFFVNGNAWVEDLAPRSYVEHKFYEKHMGEKMVKRVSELMRENDEFFIALFLTDSHIPYDLPGDDENEVREHIELFKSFNIGEDNGAFELAKERNLRAISYLDGLVGRLLDMPDRTIFTSDPGELFG